MVRNLASSFILHIGIIYKKYLLGTAINLTKKGPFLSSTKLWFLGSKPTCQVNTSKLNDKRVVILLNGRKLAPCTIAICYIKFQHEAITPSGAPRGGGKGAIAPP